MRAAGRVALLLASIGAALACAGAPCGDGTVNKDGECVAAPDADADTDTDADSGSAATDPRVLTFSTNIAIMTEDDALSFTAVVTDPQGIGDLIGGTLLSPGGGTYGSFATESDEGAYALTLSWSAINTIEAISFGTSEDRTFIARFYDQAGNSTDAEAIVELACRQPEYGACAGQCLDLLTDVENCGACGRVCSGEVGTCTEGGCLTTSACIDDLSMSCEAACVAEGHRACNSTYWDAAGVAQKVRPEDTCATYSSTFGGFLIPTCEEPMQVNADVGIGYCSCID